MSRDKVLTMLRQKAMSLRVMVQIVKFIVRQSWQNGVHELVQLLSPIVMTSIWFEVVLANLDELQEAAICLE